MIRSTALAAELGVEHRVVVAQAERTGLLFPSAATGEVVDDAPVLILDDYLVGTVCAQIAVDREAARVHPITPEQFRDDDYVPFLQD